MPAAMSSNEPPSSSSTLTGSTRASGATPAMPVPLPVAAAAIPATCVPWVLLSSSRSAGPDSQSPLPQDEAPQSRNVAPCNSLPARSG
jgi:hypothetical protein